MKIIILTTGGTIEKNYDEKDGTLQNRETVVKNKFIQRLRLPYTELEVHSIMHKDSLVMNDEDRKLILEAIKKYENSGAGIVVLHGTDTMEISSQYCFQNYKSIKVPVVFTGAMKPLEFEDSDAKQNIIEALFAAKIAKPGYYISFHNHLFTVPDVKKNKGKGTFEPT